ncbi:MAG: aminotransferase class III-fold pyridoxal phosphate-dependent enzyme, partial [Gammaproteobacteria bacterium]
MLGGYGSTLFGHNHPALVRVLTNALEEQRPQFVQMANRTAAGTLAKELNRRLGELTGDQYVAVLGSTGGEIVDAALKHALYEWAARRGRLLNRRQQNARLPGGAPVVLAVEGSYHGKTLGAYSLTWNVPGRKELGFEGPFEVVWLKRDDAANVRETFERYARTVSDDDESASWSRIAGVFVEPIQGEGGIRPLSEAFLEAIRREADRAECPIIVDEIQSGLGRAGSFTAASLLGLTGDYYLFGKSLGGGLTKISALLIRAERYQSGFGFVHTSTFAEDDHSALVALRALSLLDEDSICERCAQAGAYLLERLADLKLRYPHVVTAVRGRGLMIGVELAEQSANSSKLIRELHQRALFVATVASHLLHRHGLRVGTTIGQSSTLRLEPSAYVSTAHRDRVVRAFEEVCKTIDAGDAATLLRHLTHEHGTSEFRVEGDWAGGVQSEAIRTSALAPGLHDGTPSAVFLGHLIDADNIGSWDPSLMTLSPVERETLAQRISDSLLVNQIPLKSKTGETLNFEIRTLGLTSAVIERAFRSGESKWIVERVIKAVEQFAAQDVRVVGLGGLLSIVTRNGLAVQNDRASMQLTTGNTYTVALAREAIIKATRECGLDPTSIQLGVVGAAGNIGSTLVHVLSDEFSRFCLVGRDGSQSRVVKVAESVYADVHRRWQSGGAEGAAALLTALAETPVLRAVGSGPEVGARIRNALIERYGTDPFFAIAASIQGVSDCSVIATASNSITPIFDVDNVGAGVRVICDVSIPSDVDPHLMAARTDLVLIRGGVARAPQGNQFIVATAGLPQNHLLACMAETAILGLAGGSHFPTIGDVDSSAVRECSYIGRR